MEQTAPPPSGDVRIARFATLTLAGLILDRAMALLLTILMSIAFGASSQLDAYLVAAAGPSIVATLLGDVAYSLLLPEFMRLRRESIRSSETWDLVILAALLLAVLTVAYAALWTVTVEVIGRGREGNLLMLGLLTTPLIFLVGLGGVGATALIAAGRYTTASIRFPISSLVSIASFVVAIQLKMGVIGLACSVVVGASVSALLVTGALVGVEGRPDVRLRNAGLISYAHRLGRSSLALLVTGIVSQAATPVERLVGFWLGAGIVSSLNYGRVLVSPPLLLGQAVATATYPRFVRMSRQDREKLLAALSRSIGLVIFLVWPLSILLMTIPGPLIELVYHRGAFDQLGTVRTTASASILASGLVPVSVSAVVIRFMYATGRQSAVAAVSSLTLVAYLAMALSLGASFGYVGLAIASSLSVLLTAVALILMASRANSAGWSLVPWGSALRTALAGTGVGAGIVVAHRLFVPVQSSASTLGDITLTTVVGLTTYFVAAYLLGSRESIEAASFVRRVLHRTRIG